MQPINVTGAIDNSRYTAIKEEAGRLGVSISRFCSILVGQFLRTKRVVKSHSRSSEGDRRVNIRITKEHNDEIRKKRVAIAPLIKGILIEMLDSFFSEDEQKRSLRFWGWQDTTAQVLDREEREEKLLADCSSPSERVLDTRQTCKRGNLSDWKLHRRQWNYLADRCLHPCLPYTVNVPGTLSSYWRGIDRLYRSSGIGKRLGPTGILLSGDW